MAMYIAGSDSVVHMPWAIAKVFQELSGGILLTQWTDVAGEHREYSCSVMQAGLLQHAGPY